jgi:hypothetical protein
MGPVDHLKFCNERGRLLDLLNAATRAYHIATCGLLGDPHAIGSVEYARMQENVEHARFGAQHARQVLAQHRQEHGC